MILWESGESQVCYCPLRFTCSGDICVIVFSAWLYFFHGRPEKSGQLEFLMTRWWLKFTVLQTTKSLVAPERLRNWLWLKLSWITVYFIVHGKVMKWTVVQESLCHNKFVDLLRCYNTCVFFAVSYIMCFSNHLLQQAQLPPLVILLCTLVWKLNIKAITFQAAYSKCRIIIIPLQQCDIALSIKHDTLE